MLALVLVLNQFARALWSGLRSDPEFRGLALLVVIVLSAGTIFYWRVEGWSPLDALYASVITLTTVGYGDFTPKTAAGKVFTIVYIFAGIGILLGFINKVAESDTGRPLGARLRARRAARRARTEQEQEQSPEVASGDPPA